MQIALADKDSAVRRGALDILPALPIPAAAKVQHLTSIVERGAVARAAGRARGPGHAQKPGVAAALATYLDALVRGHAGAAAAGRPARRGAGRRLGAARRPARERIRRRSTPTAWRRRSARGCCAAAMPERGMQVILENPAAECTRCHTISGRGTDVGPELTRIGSTLTRDQLLDALMAPNAGLRPATAPWRSRCAAVSASTARCARRPRPSSSS